MVTISSSLLGWLDRLEYRNGKGLGICFRITKFALTHNHWRGSLAVVAMSGRKPLVWLPNPAGPFAPSSVLRWSTYYIYIPLFMYAREGGRDKGRRPERGRPYRDKPCASTDLGTGLAPWPRRAKMLRPWHPNTSKENAGRPRSS